MAYPLIRSKTNWNEWKQKKQKEKRHPMLVQFGMISECLYEKSWRNLKTVIKLYQNYNWMSFFLLPVHFIELYFVFIWYFFMFIIFYVHVLWYASLKLDLLGYRHISIQKGPICRSTRQWQAFDFKTTSMQMIRHRY